MPAFTPTQGRYLAFIHQYTELHGGPPAESEIARALCVMPPSVNQMIRSLEQRGLSKALWSVCRSLKEPSERPHDGSLDAVHHLNLGGL